MSGRINLDPVVPHCCPHLFAGGFRDDDIGCFHRHMAIDAIGCNFLSHRFCHAAALPLVAGKASVGICCCGSLWCMNVMTSRAGHGLRRTIAAAPLQQADLIAMHVRMLNGVGRDWFEIIAERPSRHVGKGRRHCFPLDAIMAQSTQIHLPIARELRGILNCLIGPFCHTFFLLRNVISAGAVAGLARDSGDQAVFVIRIRQRIRRKRSDIGRMALQAAGIDWPRKIG